MKIVFLPRRLKNVAIPRQETANSLCANYSRESGKSFLYFNVDSRKEKNDIFDPPQPQTEVTLGEIIRQNIHSSPGGNNSFMSVYEYLNKNI
jgi:hypothetical protein